MRAKTERLPIFCALLFSACVAFCAEPAGAGVKRVALFFGDSITAGYGLDDPSLAYPGLIQAQADAEGIPCRVVNAGLSGETTSGGLRRVDWILRQRLDVFVLALGANDGLRGISPDLIEANLVEILKRVRARYPHAELVLIGMRMPAEMGASYTERYGKAFAAAAKKSGAHFIPFLLEGVGGVPAMNQNDGIHPNIAGQQRIAETLWPQLRPALIGVQTATP